VFKQREPTIGLFQNGFVARRKWFRSRLSFGGSGLGWRGLGTRPPGRHCEARAPIDPAHSSQRVGYVLASTAILRMFQAVREQNHLQV
jgi:hypothetical protein